MEKIFYYSSIYFYTQVNILLYYIGKLPFIGKHLPEKVYRMYRRKKICIFFGVCYGFLKKIIVSNIELILMVYLLPMYLYRENEISSGVYIIIFIVGDCICSAVNECNLFTSSVDDYSFLNHFMVNPNSYYQYKIVKNTVDKGVCKMIGLAWLVRNPIIAFVLIVVKCTFLNLGDLLHLSYFKRKGRMPNKYVRRLITGIIVIITYLLGYYGYYNSISVSNPVWCIAGILCGAIGTFCVYKLFMFRNYKAVAVRFANQKVVSLKLSVGGSGSETEYDFREDNWEQNKAYYEKNKGLSIEKYMDQTFYHRYRKVLLRDSLSQLIFYLVVYALLGLAVRYGIIKINGNNIMEYSTILLFSIAGLGIATKYSKLLFRNIDIFMMSNHICDRDYVKRSMLLRYRILILYDLMLTMFAACYLYVFELSSRIFLGAKTFLLLILACGIYLLIWETYEIAMYYYVQPYSVEMTAKSPVYNVLSYFELIFNAVVIFVRSDISKAIMYMFVIAVVEIGLFVGFSGKAYKSFRVH